MIETAGGEKSDLAFLIDPLPPDNFFAGYWEQKPYHCRRGVEPYYQNILGAKDLEKIIASADLRYPALQLARNGSYLPAEAYTRNIKHGSEFFNGVPDIERVLAEYRSGATIVLPACQRSWPSLNGLCTALEDYFDHPVHANAYLTPGNSTGFTPHYDTHEVFVLQIGGRKHWRVYNPPLPLPHRSQPFNPGSYKLPPAPHFQFDLSPGDLLYLPRGFVHTAATSEGYSAHLTIGVTVYTWFELVLELLSAGRDLEGFRKALPAGFAARENLRAMLQEGLLERLDELRQHSDCASLVDSFTHRVRSARFRSGGSFALDVDTAALASRSGRTKR